MYTGSTSSGCANAVFTEIRNTPLESLNTEGFRRRLSEAISHSVSNNSEPCDEDECRLEDKLRIASMYNVHFLPLDTGGATGQAHVYSFDGFPGIVEGVLVHHRLRVVRRSKLLDEGPMRSTTL